MGVGWVSKYIWCFTPNQPVHLHQGKGGCGCVWVGVGVQVGGGMPGWGVTTMGTRHHYVSFPMGNECECELEKGIHQERGGLPLTGWSMQTFT